METQRESKEVKGKGRAVTKGAGGAMRGVRDYQCDSCGERLNDVYGEWDDVVACPKCEKKMRRLFTPLYVFCRDVKKARKQKMVDNIMQEQLGSQRQINPDIWNSVRSGANNEH